VSKTGEVIKQANEISEVVNGPASECRITTVLASAHSILEMEANTRIGEVLKK